MRLVESDEFKRGSQALRGALTTLDKRERFVVRARRLPHEPLSLLSPALELGISSERRVTLRRRRSGRSLEGRVSIHFARRRRSSASYGNWHVPSAAQMQRMTAASARSCTSAQIGLLP
jgi:hypothetical protein